MSLKYYASFENGKSHIKEYDESNGIRRLNATTVAIYHSSVLVSELFDTLDECIRDFGGYSKPVVLPDGTEIIPSAVNFPNDFNAQCEAIGLFRWHPGITEIWPGEEGYEEDFSERLAKPVFFP